MCICRTWQFAEDFAHAPLAYSAASMAGGELAGLLASLALRSLGLNLHTNCFNWHSCCTVLLDRQNSESVCYWWQLFSLFSPFPPLLLIAVTFQFENWSVCAHLYLHLFRASICLPLNEVVLWETAGNAFL